MKTFLHTSKGSPGFSLIEMIITIAAIAILVGIAMVAFANVDAASQAKDQRNAQSLCTLYTSAEAAGVRLIHEGMTKLDVLQALRDGVKVEHGAFKGQTFVLPNVADKDLAGAGKYLEVRDGQMLYLAGGGAID